MDKVTLPAESVPVIARADLAVIGGSCTGAFAAIRAARLGAKVVLIEKQNRCGGVAVSSMVSIWHSLFDTDYRQPVIAGLTREILDRLERRRAVTIRDRDPSAYAVLNTEELALELDVMLAEAGVETLFHTLFSAPYHDCDRLAGVVVDNKSGRGVILADYFIDASGDADLCRRCGWTLRRPEHPQPPTACARFSGWHLPDGFDLGAAVRRYAADYNLPEGFIWGADVPGSDVHMLAGTRVFRRDCADAADLSAAEIEGRRQIRAIMDILHDRCKINGIVLQALPSMIGIRDSRHIDSAHRLTGAELLHGTRFDDAIANGTYRVDIHLQDRPGLIFRYLDGREVYHCPGRPSEAGRWREPGGDDPKFYQIPLRSLIPKEAVNVITAGRMIDADPEAFGAVRVMVNLNQTGEAAGVAAALALSGRTAIGAVPAAAVRRTLAAGGSLVL